MTRSMESKQRYRNFLLSIKSDKAADIAKERCGHIRTQVPHGIRYAVGSIVGSGSEAVLYIAISFVHGRHLGGLKLEFWDWTTSGFSNIKDACERTSNGAEQVFVVGDLPRQGKRKLAGAKKRTREELERDNQVLREQNNDLVDKLKQAGEASRARECDLIKQLKQAGEASRARECDLIKQLKQADETIKARETAGLQFLDGYLQGVAPPFLGVLNTVEKLVNPSSSRPRLNTEREAFLRYHPDKQNSKYGAGRDQEWNARVSGVICKHLTGWKK